MTSGAHDRVVLGGLRAGVVPPGSIPATRSPPLPWGRAILPQTELGYGLENVHLIGHSLGAHAAAEAGRRLGGRVGRITGRGRGGRAWVPARKLRPCALSTAKGAPTGSPGTDFRWCPDLNEKLIAHIFSCVLENI